MLNYTAARIIFQEEVEDEEQPRTRTRTITEKPSNTSSFCPDDLDWCDEPRDYPENIILKAVAKQKKTVKMKEINETSEIGVRMFKPQFENICDVETMTSSPGPPRTRRASLCSL